MAKVLEKPYISVPHDKEMGLDAAAYAALVTPQTQVATILHTSPVTGMGVDVAAVSSHPRCCAGLFIIADGIQHAAHGLLVSLLTTSTGMSFHRGACAMATGGMGVRPADRIEP